MCQKITERESTRLSMWHVVCYDRLYSIGDSSEDGLMMRVGRRLAEADECIERKRSLSIQWMLLLFGRFCVLKGGGCCLMPIALFRIVDAVVDL